jgi:hypothetical protein
MVRRAFGITWKLGPWRRGTGQSMVRDWRGDSCTVSAAEEVNGRWFVGRPSFLGTWAKARSETTVLQRKALRAEADAALGQLLSRRKPQP